MAGLIRSTNRIARFLTDVENGDDLKVRTDGGYHITDSVSHVQSDVVGHDREIAIGETDSPHLLVYVDQVGESIGEMKDYETTVYGPGKDGGYEKRGRVVELHDLSGI